MKKKRRSSGLRSGAANSNRQAAPGPVTERPKLQPRTASDVERLMRIERRKARKRAIGMAILVLLVMLLTTLLIIMVMNRTKPRPRLMFIQEGSVTHSVRSSGLILRDETVFTAPAGGIVKPLATEGSRVSKGQKLALVIPESQVEKIRELQKYEQDIVDLQIELMNAGKGSGARAIYDESNAALSSIINLVRSDITRQDLSSLSGYASSMSVLMDQRSTRLLSVDFRDARIDQLRSSQNQLELSLGLDSGTIICQKPGILSFQLDGMEEPLNTDQVNAITSDQLLAYLDQSSVSRQPPNEVSAEDPILRITGGLFQILMFYLPDTSPDAFELDANYNLSIPADGITIPNCRVVRSVAVGSDALVAFQTDRRIEWFSNRRQLEAELVTSETSGMRVPVAALMDSEGVGGYAEILLVADGYTRKSRVRILDSDRDHAIIEADETSLHKPGASTILVVNPASIEEGEFIGD